MVLLWKKDSQQRQPCQMFALASGKHQLQNEKEEERNRQKIILQYTSPVIKIILIPKLTKTILHTLFSNC